MAWDDPGNRRLDDDAELADPRVSAVVTWLARLEKNCELKLASSGGGDPEDGVDGEGDIGSDEFMSTMTLIVKSIHGLRCPNIVST